MEFKEEIEDEQVIWGCWRSRLSSRRRRRRMNIFWLCLRSLWSSRRKEEDEQMIWRVLE